LFISTETVVQAQRKVNNRVGTLRVSCRVKNNSYLPNFPKPHHHTPTSLLLLMPKTPSQAAKEGSRRESNPGPLAI
jgi:hypothetical protein